MLRGLYSATSGMMIEGERNRVLADNLANIDTVGHKKQKVAFKSFPDIHISRIHDRLPDEPPFTTPWDDPYIGTMGTGSLVDELFTDLSQGRLKHTGEELHVALAGPAYFMVKSPKGYRLTKDGTFHVDVDGRVVNSSSNPLMVVSGDPPQGGTVAVNENGVAETHEFHELYIDRKKEITIDQAGRIWEGQNHIATIAKIATDQTKTWRKEVNSHFKPNGAVLRFDDVVEVKQQYLELSNVNPVTEMVQMIEVQRFYEMNQRMISSHDQSLTSLFRILQAG